MKVQTKQVSVIILCNYDVVDSVTDVAKQTVKALCQRQRTIMVLDIEQSIPFRKIIQSPFDSIRRLFDVDKQYGAVWFHPLLLPFSLKWSAMLHASMAINCFFFRLWLQHMYPLEKKIIWIIHPHIAFIVSFFPNSFYVLYDIVDYFTYQDKKRAMWMEKQKDILFRRADFVCSISKQLKDIYDHQFQSKIIVVPQGFDEPKEEKIPQIPLLSTSPIIGFTGRLSERLDMNLLILLCKRNPLWTFVFVGPITHEPHVISENYLRKVDLLVHLPNVKYIPQQPRETVYAYIRQFDVCIIPYDTKQLFNKYCYPMKLFEYFYMGKPVISTPIEELKRFPKFVKIGKNEKEWENHIHKLLAKPWSKTYQRREYQLALKNSWKKKIHEILNILG